MEGNLGVIFKEQKKEETKAPALLTGILAIIMIITYVYTLKMYAPAENLILTGGIIIYPFSFLIMIFISKNYGFKAARKSIFTASLIYIVFILFIMFSSLFTATNATMGYDSILQYVFVNDVAYIGDFRIFYPLLGQYFGVLISFIVSHLLFATIYNALKKFTVDYLNVGLSVFIAYIIDRLVFMPLLYAEGLITKANTFDYFIKCLTSEFIAAILASVLIIITYVIIVSMKKMIKKN